MVFWDNPYFLIATTSLLIQIAVLGLLSVGYLLKRQKKFRKHGMYMAGAVILHFTTIFVVMIPSFVLAVVPEFIIPAPLEEISLIGLFHGIGGIIAAVLGAWFVVSWRFKTDLKPCFKKKLLMRFTIIVWIFALLLGIYLYFLFYGPMLMN
jgi:uncharacterized membrane protein YozB (DUF420 family)